jgi:hypothetical protein
MKRALAALAALTVMAAATAAGANAITITYQGFVSGTDSLGLFGTAGGELDNAPYTVVFTIGSLSGSTTTVMGAQTEVSGGTLVSSVSPVTSFTLTIDGANYTDDLAPLGDVTSIFESPTYGRNEYTVGGVASGGAFFVQDIVGQLDNASIFRSFDFTGPYYNSGGFFNITIGQESDELSFQPEGVSVAGAAPEPGAWILMMAGMFSLGGMMRGRRGGRTAHAVRRALSPIDFNDLRAGCAKRGMNPPWP